MSLIDEIEAGRKADSQRNWRFVESMSPNGEEWMGCGVSEVTCDEFIWFEHDPEQDIPRAHRIARVPQMEAAIVAAYAVLRKAAEHAMSDPEKEITLAEIAVCRALDILEGAE